MAQAPMAPTTFVDLETARAARGVRLVVAANLPSPWSEAAKSVFRVKGIPFVAVRLALGDKDVKQWTRSRNAPAAMFDDEPARTGWADILELAERVGGEASPSLVPSDAHARAAMFGLCHEVMGEGGLLWSSRILTIHAGIETNGERGFPPQAAGYLGARYGYAKERLDLARGRVTEGLALLTEQLGDKPYYFGDAITALDIYSAAALNTLVLLSEEDCPMWAPIRAAFASMASELGEVSPSLVAHRDRMYAKHLELPILM